MNKNVDVYSTICLKSHKSNAIEHELWLSGMPIINFKQVMMPNIFVGENIIVACSECKISTYKLDNIRRPFQISGTRDLLIDANSFQDLTSEYTKTIYYANFILTNLFMELTLEEIEDNPNLIDWECLIKETSIPNKFNFEKIKELCLDKLPVLQKNNCINRLEKKITQIEKPVFKSKITDINWESYDITD
jgi:hypothetical protein